MNSKLVTKVTQTRKNIMDLKKSFIEASQSLFYKAIYELFEQYPELESISWGQGNHWNDEEDVFEVNINYPVVNGVSYDYDYDKDIPEYCKQVQHFLNLFEVSDYKMIFGQETTVKITREGIEFSRYDY